MRMNSVNQNFCATIPYNTAAKKVNRVLNRASIYDYVLTDYMDYKILRKRINEILPDKEDVVSFSKVEPFENFELSYKIKGNIRHNNENKEFCAVAHCDDGSWLSGNRIIKAIKSAINQ